MSEQRCCCGIDFIFELEEEAIDFEFADIYEVGDFDHYEGAYIVTPKAFDETILETKNKVMDDNVQVLEIPYDETTNPHGTTVVIAS